MTNSHDCEVCGDNAVIRQNDGHYYCFRHHETYCRGKTFEQMMKEVKP